MATVSAGDCEAWEAIQVMPDIIPHDPPGDRARSLLRRHGHARRGVYVLTAGTPTPISLSLFASLKGIFDLKGRGATKGSGPRKLDTHVSGI